MRSAFRRRRRGIACRGAGTSGLPTAAGPWDRQSHPTGGARRPLRTLAVPGGQRCAEPRSFSAPCPALRAAGPVARRALRQAGRSWPSAPVPPEDRPVGAVRGPSPAGHRAGPGRPGVGAGAGPVRAPGTGLSGPDGPKRRAPGPDRVSGGWSTALRQLVVQAPRLSSPTRSASTSTPPPGTSPSPGNLDPLRSQPPARVNHHTTPEGNPVTSQLSAALRAWPSPPKACSQMRPQPG
jgi:hypothetical protein